MRLGIDAAFAGTTQDFNQAFMAGVEWVGEYLGGAGCFHVWTNADRAALAASRIPYRLPIWVPQQSFNSNPNDEATEAITAHRALGFKRVIALDVEHNSGYTVDWGETFGRTIENAGLDLVVYHGNDKEPPSMAADWLAFWTGNPPQTLGSQKAVQYRGATDSYGMSVDFDVCADDFPLEGLTTGGNNVDVSGLPKGKLAAPISCAIEKPDRTGGWLIGADGGVFVWGHAGFFGSAANIRLAAPIVAAIPANDGNGYTLIGSDGGTFVYGNGPKIGSLA